MDQILQAYQVRKSNKQKSDFIEYLKERLAGKGYDPDREITVDSKGSGLFLSRNILVGNPQQAEVIFTAHYDTCAVLPFPNMMAPTNPVLFILIQLLLVVIIFFLTGAVGFLVGLTFQSGVIAYFTFLGALIFLMVQMMFGIRNKHTANDNTSGVVVLTQFLEALSPEHREKVCVVYFDNEEKGLFGSSFFAKKYKKVMKNKLLINFDCVGDGKNVVSLAKSAAGKDSLYELFVNVLKQTAEGSDVKFLHRRIKPMMFPSDQMHFRKGVGICALKKSPLGMYCARIHTPFDTKCREENVNFLVKGMREFAEKI